jgi:triacylglycerol esterase/lipase EstA (alpha/beta hydrolase family)
MLNRFCGGKIRLAGYTWSKMLAAVSLAVICWITPVYASPNDTIVLIHGFLGWGRLEMFEVKYWGGIGQDYEEILNQAGYQTVTVAVGPIASNWDRAVEAYYQLKGGCVDYGAAHARRFGHERFGRCYEKPLLSRWDEKHKINIISHSQGGQTARVLIHLLEYGNNEEQAATGRDTAAIFRGGHLWVRSATTLSTPHNGTTLTKGALTLTFNMAEQLIAGIAGLVKASDILSTVYDFKLDQWGLKMQAGETYQSYISRIKKSSLLKSPARKDLAIWDLSPEGARELNGWVKTSPNVYYFSVSTASTEKDESSSDEHPVITNAVIFLPAANWMGSYRNTKPGEGEVLIDDTWAKNDSVVNTVSMKGPEGSTIAAYDGKPRKGIWQDMGTWTTWDHMDIIGQTRMWNLLDGRNPKDFYLNHAKFLNALN